MKYFLVILSLLFCFSTFGQTNVKIAKSSAVYLNYLPNEKKVEWFLIEPKDNSPEEPAFLSEKMIFKLNRNQDFRFYINWMNPLLYKITWSDSVEKDEAYTQLDGFISGVKQIFGVNTNSSSSTSPKSIGIVDPNQANVNIGKISLTQQKADSVTVSLVKINFPTRDILSSNIREFYFLLQLVNSESLSNNDRNTINSWEKRIENFDKNFFINHQKIYSENLDKLLKLTSADAAINTTSSIKTQVNNREKENSNELLSIDLFNKSLEDFKLEGKLVEAQLKSKLESSITEAKTLNQNEKLAIENIKPILNLFEASLANSSNKNNVFDIQYFRSNSASYKTGEQIKSRMTLTEYKYDSEKKSFTALENEISSEFVIQKYNFIYPTVSTGFFYSDSDIVTYGLSNSDNSTEFLVTQDTLEKNTALVAAFANFNFDLNNDFLHPFLQIGVDPTKIRPYMLLGGGLFIPYSKFAISGGFIFTWQQSLKTLEVGDSVKSTTDLQNDIQYGVFDVKRKGWYVGIQYNF